MVAAKRRKELVVCSIAWRVFWLREDRGVVVEVKGEVVVVAAVAPLRVRIRLPGEVIGFPPVAKADADRVFDVTPVLSPRGCRVNRMS